MWKNARERSVRYTTNDAAPSSSGTQPTCDRLSKNDPTASKNDPTLAVIGAPVLTRED